MEKEDEMRLDFFPEQRRMLFDPAQFVSMAIGRRWGKTYGLSMWMIAVLLQDDTRPGLWVDTRHANIDKYVERYFKNITGRSWKHFKYNQQKKILYFPNENYLDFGSAEKPQSMEGFGYGWGVLNEAGIILKKPGLWDNTLRPMFNQDSSVRIAGTPKGKGKFFDLFHRGKTDGTGRYKSFQVPSITSPYCDDQWIADVKKELPERSFRQEILAEFIEGEGSVFKSVDKILTSDSLLERGESDRVYMMGIDLGRTVDYTVILVGDVETKKIVYSERFRNPRWTYIFKRIVDVYERFNQPLGIIDATGMGSKISEDLRNANVNVQPVVYTSAIKMNLIDNLSIAIENKEIAIPNILDYLIEELNAFEYDLTPQKTVRYSAPQGYHDDGVNALALLNSGWTDHTVSLSFV